MKRTATITWKGSGKEGSGTMTTQSGFLDKAPFAYSSRFEDARGTNPEELIGAAHAGCFTMKLSFLLTEAGFVPELLETRSEVTLSKDGITHAHLSVKGNVPGISKSKFEELAKDAKENCIVSRALKARISIDVEFEEKDASVGA